jgi:hypothetical protein
LHPFLVAISPKNFPRRSNENCLYSGAEEVGVMTSGRAGALKPREPLKADDQWPPSKGGLPSVARPGGKGLARRNHEAPLIPWNGRASKLRNADCGMRIENESQKNPKSEIRNPK